MTTFWRQHPALLYGLGLLVGISIYLSSSLFPLLLMVVCIPGVVASRDHRWRLMVMLLWMIAGYGYAHTMVLSPNWRDGTLRGKQYTGTAEVTFSSVQPTSQVFGNGTLYRGTITHFYDENGVEIAYGLPCTVYVAGKSRPPADHRYLIEGTLSKSRWTRWSCRLNPSHNNWIPIANSWSPAEWRYRFKESLLDALSAVHNGRGADFLGGLATGTFRDKTLTTEFGRFGLQHLLAISGFHFAIVAALLSVVFRRIFSYRLASATLVVALALYFFALGPSSSIIRAWTMATVALSAAFMGRPSIALNSLGIALLAVLFYRPTACLEAGFQLSFGATAAILLFYRPFEEGLQLLFPKRKLATAVQMPPADQHFYLIGTAFRHAIALSIAVHLVVIPLSLYHFHRFALMGLAYNLFFPFVVSLAMMVLLPAMVLLWLVPAIGQPIIAILLGLIERVLQLVTHAPLSLDAVVYWRDMSNTTISSMMLILLVAGIWLWNRFQQGKHERDWQFV